ncbi:hypothetical protein H8D85_02425 [bacterium]|nr:hypothetical protein [bacterium]
MTLIEACKIAKEGGLKTIGEAVDNIELIAMSIFPYKDIPEEMLGIYEDPIWKQLDITVHDNIAKVLKND